MKDKEIKKLQKELEIAMTSYSKAEADIFKLSSKIIVLLNQELKNR